MTNQLIDIEVDRALSETYFVAVHVTESTGQQWQEITFGRYVDNFERRWRRSWTATGGSRWSMPSDRSLWKAITKR